MTDRNKNAEGVAERGVIYMSLWNKMDQVGFVVRDADQAAKVLAEEWGLDGVIVSNFGRVEGMPEFNSHSVSVEDVCLDGKKLGSCGYRMVFGKLNNGTQLKLVQPMGNTSIYQQYLDEFGPSGRYIRIGSDKSYVEVIGKMGAAGNPVGQTEYADRQEHCAFVRHPELGISIEVCHKGPDFTIPNVEPKRYQPNRETLPGPLLGNLTTIGLSTLNLERAMELLAEQYEIGPWTIEDMKEVGMRRASCRALNITLEIMNPYRDDSPMIGWLKKNKGPGIHHIGFDCPLGYEETLQILEAKGRHIIRQEGNSFEAAFVSYMDVFGTSIEFRK